MLGKQIYDAKCVECHGKDGKGDGVAAVYLNPRPRNFVDGKYKFRSTESGSIPTDDDLMNTIRSGLHGSAMPDWKPFLNDDSLKAVVDYIKSFSPRFQSETPKAVRLGVEVSPSPASIAAGKTVYHNLQCASCHGSDGTGDDAVAKDLADDWGHVLNATNLTEPWTFRGGSSPRDIYMRFRTGIDGSPMPSYIGTATEKEMWNLANYVFSLARKPVWSMSAEEITELYSKQETRMMQNPLERGKYMVNYLGCVFCHSPVRMDGSLIESMRFAGGQKMDLYPFGVYVSYNLTPDKETGLGNWTEEQFKTFLTKGIRRDGTRMLPFPMPWPAYAHLREDDLSAIFAYLKTIPPVYNKIPEPQQMNFFSYLWGKFRVLILKEVNPSYSYPGNSGSTQQESISGRASETEARP